MIEITTGTLEEQILKEMQKTYPITVKDLLTSIQVSEALLLRTLKKLQTQGVIAMEPLPDTIFLRLLRSDIKYVGKKRQKKFIKHHHSKRTRPQYIEDNHDSVMYQ